MQEKLTKDFYVAARKNMVQNQIIPYGVTNQGIIDAFNYVPKEEFIDNKWADVAYVDHTVPVRNEEIFIDDNRYVMPSNVFAKMLQLSGVKKEHRVLDVACNSGYSTAVIACVAQEVFAIDEDKWLLNQMSKKLQKLSIKTKLTYDTIRDFKLFKGYGKFNIIIVNAVISEVPSFLNDALEDNGKILCLEREKYSAQAICYKKEGVKLKREELFNVDADDRLNIIL